MQSFMEIDVKALILALWRRAWVVVLCAIAAAGIALVYTANFVTPLYRASVSVYVNNAPQSQSIYVDVNSIYAAQRLVLTYLNMIRSYNVLEKVVEEGNLDISAEAIRTMMTASSLNGSEIFQIHITHKDPEMAAKIANAVAEIAPQEISNFLEGSSTKIVDYARVPTSSFSPDYRGKTIQGAGIGAGVAAIGILLVALLDKRIKSQEDLEALFTLPILGTIPDFEDINKGKRKKYSKYNRYGNPYAYATAE